MLVLGLCLSSVVTSLFVITFFFFFSTACSGASKKQYLGLLSIPCSFLLLGILPVLFSLQDGADSLFSIPLFGLQLTCTVQSLRAAVLLFVKAIAAVSCMYFLSLTTTMPDLLQALKRFHVPVMVLTLMELIYRYIFVLFEEAGKMRTAQRSRLGYQDFKTSMQSTGQLVAGLFLRAYTRCDRVYNALLSRGYEGELRTLGGQYRRSNKLTVLLVLLVGTMLALTYLEGAWGWK